MKHPMKYVAFLVLSPCLVSAASAQGVGVKVSVSGDFGIKEQVTSKLNRHFRKFNDVTLTDGDAYL